MIELKQDALEFSFAEVHRDAVLRIDLQRTLRIPDDETDYPLPPGLGRFPLRHVDDFAARLPASWKTHGGVMFPMYQSEAMWLNFSSPAGYPFAVKVATGKINAVTGDRWRNGLAREPQDYMSIPAQPWLDGYCVEEGIIRQFVAMPLGGGYTAEEQITGEAEHGGIQLIAYPMRAEAWERIVRERQTLYRRMDGLASYSLAEAPASMGLAPGGRMRQAIHQDPYPLSDWDDRHSSRCFVHIANSLVWRAITGEDPPTVPPTAEEYERAGLPWFDWYSENPARPGGRSLDSLRSVRRLGQEKGEVPLPENESVTPKKVIGLGERRRKDQVREGAF
jgi:hypothetical protein